MTDLLTQTGAVFSACKRYRYNLWRAWDTDAPTIVFVMLNPSTANETTNDPTVERCQRRAKMWNYGRLEVVNIFALRSTDPQLLYKHAAPVGDDNDGAILKCAGADLVICAWGAHGKLLERGHYVLHMLRDAGAKPHALAIGASGQPCHPLYLPYSLRPMPM